jgi:flagellar motor switch/type III secretory pathway protein FliN
MNSNENDFKVGDWVQVIPSASAHDDLGKIFQIKEPKCDGIYYRTKDTNTEYWPFLCLRKLSEEEVKKMNMKNSEKEIHEIANQISFFLGKHNVPLDRLKRLHQKFYELEDCMKSILWDEEYRRKK